MGAGVWTPTIVFEDEHLVVVDKPAGVVVHPTYKNVSDTLLDALRSSIGWQGSERPSIVGRLDRLTSGIVIVAKTSAAHAALQRALSGDCEKLYDAVVDANVEAASGIIDFPLTVDPRDRRRVIVDSGGAPSLTRFERVERSGGRSRLLCRLATGRRHQIRVHLSACGWPVTGDAVYGAACAGWPRHALHARRVAMVHPFTGVHCEWQVEAPEDFRALLTRKAEV